MDPVVGKGKTPDEQIRNRKLRQALSIAIDWEEFVRVFESKAAGEPAMSAGAARAYSAFARMRINRDVYDVVDGKPKPQVDRSGEEAARRSGLPRRPRCQDRRSRWC